MEEKLEQLNKLKSTNKKLLIAFIILLIILIIFIVLTIIENNKTNSITPISNKDLIAIERFNSKFDGDLGNRVAGSIVKSLLNEIRRSNAEDKEHQVLVNGSEDIPENSAYSSSSYYTVDAEYENGYICNINIESNL